MRTRKLSKFFYRKNPWEKAVARNFRAKHFGIHQAVLRAIASCPAMPSSGDHLDVAAGPGNCCDLSERVIPFRSFGCDYTDKLLSVPGPRIDTVDLNRQPLPYTDNRFALVTCIETIEHLENYRDVIREIYRVLQPGGVAVFSTPNILNLRSRLRYLSSGFYNLFGPLAPDESDIHTTRGHINPVSWFYLSHALLSSWFPRFES